MSAQHSSDPIACARVLLAQNDVGAVRLGGSKKEKQYVQAQFYRIKARRGPKKAIMAVSTSILTAIYHM